MPDSRLSEPGFESPLCYHFKDWAFLFSPLMPLLTQLYKWVPGSGGNVSELVLARNCCLARMLPGEAELVSEWTGLSERAKSVKRFERSNGLDTALYKNIPLWSPYPKDKTVLLYWLLRPSIGVGVKTFCGRFIIFDRDPTIQREVYIRKVPVWSICWPSLKPCQFYPSHDFSSVKNG